MILPTFSDEVKFGWHFVNEFNGKPVLNNGDNREVRTGRIISISPEEKVQICSCGLHASPTIRCALKYFYPTKTSWLCFVAVWGELDKHRDKFCGKHRHVIKMWTGEEVLRKHISKDEFLKKIFDEWLKTFILFYHNIENVTGLTTYPITKKDIPPFIKEYFYNGGKNKDLVLQKLNCIGKNSFSIGSLSLEEIIKNPWSFEQGCVDSGFYHCGLEKVYGSFTRKGEILIRKFKAKNDL